MSWNNDNYNIKGPCTRDCIYRTKNGEKPNCHDVCEEYLAFKKELEEAKTKEYQGRKQGSEARGFIVEQSIRIRKRYGR